MSTKRYRRWVQALQDVKEACLAVEAARTSGGWNDALTGLEKASERLDRFEPDPGWLKCPSPASLLKSSTSA